MQWLKPTRARSPPRFRLSAHHAPARAGAHLSTAFVALAFSSGVPLLLPTAAAALALRRAVDKWLLLRHCAAPRGVAAGVAASATRLLPWALVVHMAVAVASVV